MFSFADLETSKGRSGARPLVVCVDDEPRVLAALRRALRQEPYETIATADPDRVLELIGQRPVSLVVADQRMPAMSGTRLLTIVRRESPSTLGLILSGHSSVEEIVCGINDGTVGCFIRKPWDDSDFRAAIRHLLCLREPARRMAGKSKRKAIRRTDPPRHRAILRVDCSRESASAILAELAEFLSQPEPSLCGAAVILEHLGLLRDSVSRLLTAVILKTAHSSTPVALVESSGVAKEYLRLLGSDVSFVVYPSEVELPDPKRVLLVGTAPSGPSLSRQIESAGHTCRNASSVTQAIRQMVLTSFDLVLLGRLFEDGRGVDLARRVIERLLGAPVLALPEDATAEDVLEAIRRCRRTADLD